MLRLDEAFRDPPSQSRHRLAAFVAAARRRCAGYGLGTSRHERRRRCGGCGYARRLGGSGRGGRGGCSRLCGGFEVGKHVGLGDPAVPAGARDPRRIEGMLVDEPAHRGTQAFMAGRGGGGHRGGGGNRFRDKAQGGGRRARGGVDPGEHFLAQHRVAVLLQHFGEHPRLGCRNFEHDLVGLELDQDLVLVDRVAGLLSPLEQRGVGDRLGEYRHLHVDSHCGISSDVHDSRPDTRSGARRQSHCKRSLHRRAAAPARRCSGSSHALFLRDAAWSRPSAVSTRARCWLVCTLR